MSLPDPAGPVSQLLGIEKLHQPHKTWHTFSISPSLRGRDAGRWCNDNIKGEWTFFPEYSSVKFYIRDPREAMLFKLTWVV